MQQSARSFSSRLWKRGLVTTALSLGALTLSVAPNLNAASARVVITPAAGFSITWDGNNGSFFSANAGAGPSNNIAIVTNGTAAFGSSELDFGVHFITNVNDGL